MDCFLRAHLSSFGTKYQRAWIVLPWLLGLCLGSLLACCFLHSLEPDVYFGVELINQPVCWLFLSRLSPLLLTGISVYISKRCFLALIIFLKGLLLSFSCILIISSFDTAAFVLLLLILFSEILVLPVLWLNWLAVFSGFIRPIRLICLISWCVFALLCYIDFTYVVPFLRRLIIL